MQGTNGLERDAIPAVWRPESRAIRSRNTGKREVQFHPKILDINIFPRRKTWESSKIGIRPNYS
jgi:hypothetical protein